MPQVRSARALVACTTGSYPDWSANSYTFCAGDEVCLSAFSLYNELDLIQIGPVKSQFVLEVRSAHALLVLARKIGPYHDRSSKQLSIMCRK